MFLLYEIQDGQRNAARFQMNKMKEQLLGVRVDQALLVVVVEKVVS